MKISGLSQRFGGSPTSERGHWALSENCFAVWMEGVNHFWLVEPKTEDFETQTQLTRYIVKFMGHAQGLITNNTLPQSWALSVFFYYFNNKK